MADLRELIDAFETARAAFLACPEDDDECVVEWEAYCKADEAVIMFPCQIIDDVRLKARFFLDHEAPNDTLRTGHHGDDRTLDVFLRSLLGEVQP